MNKTINTKEQEVNTLVRILFEEYKSLTIDPQATSAVTRRSEVSLRRDRAEGTGIPHTKVGKGKGSDRTMYNIYDIAKFIVSRKTKVVS